MSVPHTILLSWLFTCQKLANLVKIWWSSDKNKLGLFWHTLYWWVIAQQQQTTDRAQIPTNRQDQQNITKPTDQA